MHRNFDNTARRLRLSNSSPCISLTLRAAALIAVAASALAAPARGQFTDPRYYGNFPVGVNQFELGYAYVHANASLDPAIIIGNASLNLNQGLIDYTRYFGFLHRTAWVSPAVPIANLSGAISGTQISGSIAGAGDSSYQAAFLVKGAPALSPEEFEKYHPVTTVGVSLTMTAPTGFYRPGKVLNLGSNRWSFKPEVGVSHPFGPQQKWVLDAYANSYFYTVSSSKAGTMQQKPLPGLEGHISYSFLDNLTGSLDTRYSFLGDQTVNGQDQNNSQQNFLLGSEWGLSLNSKNVFTLELAKALVHQNGPAISGLSVRYDYYWGRGYR
jgi:hypothetical protein